MQMVHKSIQEMKKVFMQAEKERQVSLSLSSYIIYVYICLSLSLFIYTHTHVSLSLSIYIYTYKSIHAGREGAPGLFLSLSLSHSLSRYRSLSIYKCTQVSLSLYLSPCIVYEAFSYMYEALSY